MPYPHNTSQLTEIFKIERDAPWVWLLEIDVPVTSTNTAEFRLARNPVALTFGEFADGTAKTYSPAPFEVGAVKSDQEGTLRSLQVSIANPSRSVQSVLEHFNGLVDQPARVMLVSTLHLGSHRPYWEAEGQVVTAGSNTQLATIDVGQVQISNRPFPAQRILRDGCRHEYGDEWCGYDTARSGALQTCDKTRFGANGCKVHGEDEDTAGVEVLHPLRFGGAPALRRRTGLGAS